MPGTLHRTPLRGYSDEISSLGVARKESGFFKLLNEFGFHGLDAFEVFPFEVFAVAIGIPGIDIQEYLAENQV
jgi:hypothetical protein